MLCWWGYSGGGQEGPDDIHDPTTYGCARGHGHHHTASLCFGEPLHIYAAGSLTGAFTDMVKAFPAGEGNVAAPVFGPSGVLRDKIERGDHVDVFASADMTQPRALASAHSESSVVMFTRNRLCALGRASVGMTIDNTARQAAGSIGAPGNLHPRRRSGRRYAWAVFARAEALHPGAQAILQAKAMKLVGGPNSTPLVPGRGAVQGIFLADRADVMLGYCSSSEPVMREIQGLVNVPLPSSLTVGPAYGLIGTIQ